MDSGWAWVVCVASFFVQCVVFGTIQSFGTLFISLLNDFKSGESATGKLRVLSHITLGVTDTIYRRKRFQEGVCVLSCPLLICIFVICYFSFLLSYTYFLRIYLQVRIM